MRDSEKTYYSTLAVFVIAACMFWVLNSSDDSDLINSSLSKCESDFKTGNEYRINGHDVRLYSLDDDSDDITLIFDKPDD